MEFDKYFEAGMEYSAYYAGLEKAVNEKRTSGPVQSEELINYTKLNLHRSRRVYKQTVLMPELLSATENLPFAIRALCLTEYWCGDSAQILPFFHKLEETTGKLSIRILFRDENLPLMDAYLTRGGRSIPKFVFYHTQTLKELAVWGPRPLKAQILMDEMKQAGKDKPVIIEALHRWYAADKTFSIQQEMMLLLHQIQPL
jgi:hypothetical protein